ncbi:hypothetical protein BCD64_00205 [Nostoc sp. MBR 210]|nr:hypothetical protein BCD64_00205 [Nostoc sp. MBR 210]
MNGYNNRITYIFIAILGIFIILVKLKPKDEIQPAFAINNTEKVENSSNDNDEELDSESLETSLLQQNRPLRLRITVDNPDFLKVKIGQKIKKGDIITDNATERDRLSKQRQSIVLQIENLKSKVLPQPFEPKAAPAIAQLPPANFLEEESNIAQAKLKLQQAQSILDSRRSLLLSDNPEVKAEVQKFTTAANDAAAKVEEQEQLIKSMQDLRLEAPIMRHEEVKLRQVTAESQQANSALDQARAKLSSSATTQRQELEKLEVDLQLARSDLAVAQSRLETARNNRRLLEYRASIEAAQRTEESNQANLAYTRQLQEYAQQQRDRDYQLSQMQISLAAIDDKISLIPVVRSPRDGYVRKIKPWVGNNGKYNTVVTITSFATSSKNGGSDRQPTKINTTSNGKTSTVNAN